MIPNLISDPEPEGELRKFGLMRRHYLKEHRSGIYQAMLLSGKTKGTFAYDAGTGRGAV